MKTLGMALVLAVALGASGAPGGTTGSPGPQGPPGSVGPGWPAPKRLVVKTATGEVIGPVIDTDSGGRPTLRLTVYVESLGRLVKLLDPATGRSELLDVHFVAWDCSSTPMSLHDRGGVVTAAGSRLFANVRPGAVTFTKNAYLRSDGQCSRHPSPASTLPGVPLQEVFDARYPYAAPLQIVYE